ncbi:MAG: hypothetical protein HY286_13020 [Planctomycetes bacterium]|nr:hypothetical protein [Planctomycetota bacterium]
MKIPYDSLFPTFSSAFAFISNLTRAWRRRGILIALAAAGAFICYKSGRWALNGGLFPQVPAGNVGILLRKHGRLLPAGQVVAPNIKPGEEPYQGIQQDVLSSGWYPGYQPWEWEWRYLPQTVVPNDNIGVLIRCFGEDLPDGQVFADENADDDTKGILRRGPLRKILEPGSHAINLYAYDVRIFPTRSVGPGQIGVICQRYGNMPKDAKAFLSEPGERGVQKVGLAPGTHSINPLAEEVRVVSRQSNRLDLGYAGRVRFPSSDGFEVSVTGTVEWSLQDSQVPLVYVKFGDTESTEKKLILPAARAKSRIQGSRKTAREFISGATRQTFQDEFAKDLHALIEPEGIKVHSVLISGIVPPDEIAKPIRDREISLLEQEQFQKEMFTETGRAELASQTELQKRPALVSKARQKSIEAISEAKRLQEVEWIQAKSGLEVARLEKDAAAKQAESVRSTGAADAEIGKLQMEGEANALKSKVEALGGGSAFARTTLLEKLAPKLTNIMTRPDGAFLTLLRDLVPREKPVANNNINTDAANLKIAEAR